MVATTYQGPLRRSRHRRHRHPGQGDDVLSGDPDADVVVATTSVPDTITIPVVAGLPFLDRRRFRRRISGASSLRVEWPRLTELPIGRWTSNYINWLKDQCKEKKLTYTDNSTATDVDIIVKGFGGGTSSKKLKLTTSIGMGNMTYLDEDKRPVLFDSPSDVMELYYRYRYKAYEERFTLHIAELEASLKEKNYLERFLVAVCIDKTIKVLNKDTAKIKAQMVELDIPEEIFSKVSLPNLTKEGLEKIRDDIKTIIKELERMRAITVAEVWFDELEEFETAYRKKYKIKKHKPLTSRFNVEEKKQRSVKFNIKTERQSKFVIE